MGKLKEAYATYKSCEDTVGRMLEAAFEHYKKAVDQEIGACRHKEIFNNWGGGIRFCEACGLQEEAGHADSFVNLKGNVTKKVGIGYYFFESRKIVTYHHVSLAKEPTVKYSRPSDPEEWDKKHEQQNRP